MIKEKGILSLICIGLFIMAFFISSPFAEEQCLKNAWSSFNEKDYEKAIEFSHECIDNFAKDALQIQNELEKSGVPLPPKGAVSAAEKDQIFKRGLLNDVATAYWIKGRSAEYLYHKGGIKKQEYKKMAEEGYKGACKYNYGRTWDPKGWFWSPCEAASKRLPLN
jgi:hypothetical protein